MELIWKIITGKRPNARVEMRCTMVFRYLQLQIERETEMRAAYKLTVVVLMHRGL
jgi:hypothetical protein